MAKQPKNKAAKPVDYERLGRSIESIVVSGYYNRWRFYRLAFLRGIFQGVGGIVGATIVVALMLWILSLLEAVPFIGTISENIQDTVDPAVN